MLGDFFELTGADFAIERVHASSMDADEHLALPYLWAWRFFVQQSFGSTVTMDSDCVHKILSSHAISHGADMQRTR
jgi:hypothetical protein